jgi:hypothetical protein
MRKFKHAPKPIPTLTPKQWKAIEEEMNKPPTEKQRALWRRADEIYQKIKREPNDTDSV